MWVMMSKEMNTYLWLVSMNKELRDRLNWQKGDIVRGKRLDVHLMAKSAIKLPTKPGIPTPLDQEQALARLEILPNPNHPELKKPEKFVESPWTVTTVPTIDPHIWDTATITVVEMSSLTGTDPFLKRKNVASKIEALGQAETPNRSYAMCYEKDGEILIIDGHHRLMALWLLGLDKAPVWLVKEK